MAVKRIVANIAANNIDEAVGFYRDIFDLELVMDLGWIQTFAAKASASPQISIAREGGSGTAVPELSIEVDNFDEVLSRLRERGTNIEYGPIDEPWGVRRFYVRDPFGKVVNVLMHL